MLIATYEETADGWACVGEVTTVSAGSFFKGRPAGISRGEVRAMVSVSLRLGRAAGSSNTGGGDLSVSTRERFFFLTFPTSFSSSMETGLERGRPLCLLAVATEAPSIRALLGAGPPG